LPDERVDTLIAKALEEAPFRSVRSSARTMKILQTIVWRCLHTAGYVVRNRCTIPHTLSAGKKAPRVESAIGLKKASCRLRTVVGTVSWPGTSHSCILRQAMNISGSRKGHRFQRHHGRRSAGRNECSLFSGLRSIFLSPECSQRDFVLILPLSASRSFRK
jgi:hypothetical protein